MSRGSSRSRVGAVAAGWTVPERVPQSNDVDERLRDGRGRTGQMQVLIDHDNASTGPCPGCGWVPTTTRRDCPSRVIARALLDRTPVPVWVAHLVDDLPAAWTRGADVSREQQQADEDELPGLFPAPRRTAPGGDHR